MAERGSPRDHEGMDVVVEERPEGIYIAYDGTKVGPYESHLAVLRELADVARELNAIEDDVKRAILCFAPKDGIVRVVERVSDDVIALVYEDGQIKGYFKPYGAEKARLFFLEPVRKELMSGTALTKKLRRMFEAVWDGGELSPEHRQALVRAGIRLLAKIINLEQADRAEEAVSREAEEIIEQYRERALELLKDPALFYKLGKVFEHGVIVPKLNRPRFVIGEEENKRLAPILILGGKHGYTNIVWVSGDIGTAKDSIARISLELLRYAVRAEERGYFTPGAMRYSERLKNLDAIYFPEMSVPKGENVRQFRLQRADDGGIISEYTIRDPKTGRFVTVREKMPAKTIIATTNALYIDMALESAAWKLTTDASEDLTKRVLAEKLRLRAGLRSLFPEDELKAWQAAFAILDREIEHMSIPYAPAMRVLLASRSSAARRSPDMLCDLVELIANIRRYQKADPSIPDYADLYIALRLAWRAFQENVAGLSPDELLVLRAVEELGEATVRQVAEKTKMVYDTCYRRLERLVEKGYLAKDKQGRQNVYAMLQPPQPEELEKLGLTRKPSSLTPSEVLELISNIHQELLTSDAPNGVEVFQDGWAAEIADPITGERIRMWVEDGQFHYEIKPPLPEDINYPFGGEDSQVEKTRSVPASESEEFRADVKLEPSGREEPKDLGIRVYPSSLASSGSACVAGPEGPGPGLDHAHEMVELIARCGIDFELPGGVHVRARKGERFKVYRWVAELLTSRKWAKPADDAPAHEEPANPGREVVGGLKPPGMESLALPEPPPREPIEVWWPVRDESGQVVDWRVERIREPSPDAVWPERSEGVEEAETREPVRPTLGEVLRTAKEALLARGREAPDDWVVDYLKAELGLSEQEARQYVEHFIETGELVRTPEGLLALPW